MTDQLTTFGASKDLVGLCLIPLPIVATVLAFEAARGSFQWDIALGGLAYAAAVVGILARYRVTFEPDRMIYRRWGDTVRVRYAEIARIEMLENSRGQAVRALIHTKDGRRLPFWWKLFPAAVENRFLALATEKD